MQNPSSTQPDTPALIPVWDRFVRLFHWGLVATILIAGTTGFILDASWINFHVWSGATAAALLITRIIWGFSGGTYARFSSFVMGPRAILSYFNALRNGTDKRHIGHNPLGGAMVLALIATILGITATGTFLLGGVLKTGPLAALVPYAVGDIFGELHEVLAILLLVLITAHVGGVVFESRRHKENLAQAMITGEKRRSAEDVIAPKRNAQTVLAVVAAALTLGSGGLVLAMLTRTIPANMPVAQINPLVAEECSDCHMAYHPSLLPAKDWELIVNTLEDHFGEDASLDEETTTEIRDWLMANAAETADTRPAHVFKLAPKANGLPGSITDTPFWQERHEELLEDKTIFERKGIRSKSNCVACHKDAEAGLFSPFQINIPKE